ncbi:MAG: hypothetical protein ACD_2C00131G0013 [uncultured bacterium (gcode 4)]|uniref:Uncharacterized protein n=1 Tax=uncultured bacterium (gcode 4) TaxID=1234023 RepID=K2G393_9BACT|nr:MAG: hypothetical protein ACD_2C00131G0013 [uncultured bacterium (gcode 4)]
MALNSIRSTTWKDRLSERKSLISEQLRDRLRYLLGYTNIRPSKKVENFVGRIFEEFFAKMLWWIVIDTDSTVPDIAVEKDGKRYLFEIKSANRWNSSLLKLNQLEWFSKLKDTYYIFVFYDCPNPTKIYEELWMEWFIARMWLDSIYIVPAKVLQGFSHENPHLLRREKLKFIWVPTDETVIKLSKRRLEEFAITKWKKFQRSDAISHFGINGLIVRDLLSNIRVW